MDHDQPGLRTQRQTAPRRVLDDLQLKTGSATRRFIARRLVALPTVNRWDRFTRCRIRRAPARPHPQTRIGRQVRYRRAKVEEWIETQTDRSGITTGRY